MPAKYSKQPLPFRQPALIKWGIRWTPKHCSTPVPGHLCRVQLSLLSLWRWHLQLKAQQRDAPRQSRR